MRRREFAAVAAGAGLTVLCGCLDGETDDGDDADDGATDRDDASPPFDVRTVDAPGSEAGTVTIPWDGRVALVNFARTRCPTSESLLSTIDEARSDLEAADADVEVVTVVNARSGPTSTPEELIDWWVEHDGDWTLGLDETGGLNDYYDVTGYPVLVALDGDGEVHWRERGTTSIRNIVRGVETALEARD